jgi:hypothetical protein
MHSYSLRMRLAMCQSANVKDQVTERQARCAALKRHTTAHRIQFSTCTTEPGVLCTVSTLQQNTMPLVQYNKRPSQPSAVSTVAGRDESPQFLIRALGEIRSRGHQRTSSLSRLCSQATSLWIKMDGVVMVLQQKQPGSLSVSLQPPPCASLSAFTVLPWEPPRHSQTYYCC